MEQAKEIVATLEDISREIAYANTILPHLIALSKDNRYFGIALKGTMRYAVERFSLDEFGIHCEDKYLRAKKDADFEGAIKRVLQYATPDSRTNGLFVHSGNELGDLYEDKVYTLCMSEELKSIYIMWIANPELLKEKSVQMSIQLEDIRDAMIELVKRANERLPEGYKVRIGSSWLILYRTE